MDRIEEIRAEAQKAERRGPHVVAKSEAPGRVEAAAGAGEHIEGNVSDDSLLSMFAPGKKP